MNSQGANTSGIHDNVYIADALVRLIGLDSILLEKSCFLNVQDLTSSESGANRGWRGWRRRGAHVGVEKEKRTQNIKVLELKIGQLIVKFDGGGWPCCAACGILVPQLGIKPTPLALEAKSFNHWSTREVPKLFI